MSKYKLDFGDVILLICFIVLSIIWIYVLFHPAPDTDFGYYFLMYGLGSFVTLWMLGVWFMIIYGLFSKQSTNQNTTLYRVDDEYELYLKEAYEEIDEFLKKTI